MKPKTRNSETTSGPPRRSVQTAVKCWIARRPQPVVSWTPHRAPAKPSRPSPGRPGDWSPTRHTAAAQSQTADWPRSYSSATGWCKRRTGRRSRRSGTTRCWCKASEARRGCWWWVAVSRWGRWWNRPPWARQWGFGCRFWTSAPGKWPPAWGDYRRRRCRRGGKRRRPRRRGGRWARAGSGVWSRRMGMSGFGGECLLHLLRQTFLTTMDNG